jgi:hypothetical protein
MAEPRKLTTSFKGEVTIPVQTGPHTIEWQGVPCFIGVTLDIDLLIKQLGEKALKSKAKRATAFHGALVLQVKEAPRA